MSELGLQGLVDEAGRVTDSLVLAMLPQPLELAHRSAASQLQDHPTAPFGLTLAGPPFDSAVSMTLAVGGGVLVVLLTVFVVASFRYRPSGPVGMPLAVRSGFAILLVALLSGAAMIARGVVLTRTGHQEAAYHSTAPLKPLHGVSLHAVPVLPALAWLLSHTSWSEGTRRRIVATAVGCYVAAVVGAGVWAVLTY